MSELRELLENSAKDAQREFKLQHTYLVENHRELGRVIIYRVASWGNNYFISADGEIVPFASCKFSRITENIAQAIKQTETGLVLAKGVN
jgi:hypothetical protein